MQAEKARNEKLRNEATELRYQRSLVRMEADIMGDQLKRLYDAIGFLGEGKKHADKKQVELDALERKFQDLAFDKELTASELQTTTVERDRFRGEVKELARTLKKYQEDKEKLTAALKERINQLDAELKQHEAEARRWREEHAKLDKQVRQFQVEREKMRQRVQKLKTRRNFNLNQKICKNCGREYLEKENFNWSCRTHRSEFGGEMWWCCGKPSREAPGCKFAKHVSKEDEDEDLDQQEDAEEAAGRKKHAWCFCCKEKGHRAQDCPRDPNIRTQLDASAEDERITRAKTFRRLVSDSLQLTSKMLKGLLKRGVLEADFAGFARASMAFDDFAYRFFNALVLDNSSLQAINDEENLSLVAAAKGAQNADSSSALT